MKLDEIHCMDVTEFLPQVESDTISLCITSPPYWGLRDYGVDGQYGLEATPEEHIERMAAVFDEVKRVLRPDGSLWLNYGDTYIGGGRGPDAKYEPCEERGVRQKWVYRGWMQPKQLCLMPARIAIALQDGGWILRNDMIWHKKNPMPSSAKDRLSNTYEHFFHFVKQQRYWYDLDAVREPQTFPQHPQLGQNTAAMKKEGDRMAARMPDLRTLHPAGKNPGDVFSCATEPFPEAHFATFPQKLIEPRMKSSCPLWICKKCGLPRERVTEPSPEYATALGESWHDHSVDTEEGQRIHKGKDLTAHRLTVGWTDCGCDAGWRPGIVLDPFMGSGTVALVTQKLGYSWLGCDINPEYVEMTRQRTVQGYLWEQDHEPIGREAEG